MGAEGSHNSNVPPPFLTKTYEMVDDPATDGIVSWSDNKNSFVVWNVADFTQDLLPQYFKHNNFSSFVRQLNTYGFHKIDPDRQEFANDGFSKGNKEALKHIHRRKPAHTHSQQKELLLTGCSDPAHTQFEEEIKRLNKEKGSLLNELLQVRQEQATTETELEKLAQRLQGLEERQHHLLTFVARMVHNPSSQFVQGSECLVLNKKRRLPEIETFIGVGESWSEEKGQLIQYHSGDTSNGICNDQLAKSEGNSRGAESSYEQVLRQLKESTLNQSDETSPLSRTSGVTPWEETNATSGEHATMVDSGGNSMPVQSMQSVTRPHSEAGNGMPMQAVTRSLSEAAECSDFACQRGGSGDLKAGTSGLSVDSGYEVDHEEQKPAVAHEKYGVEVSKVYGSNDVFWESMLTENPRLNERWFF
eukprot:c22957_g1_i2 orf=767-2020(+)